MVLHILSILSFSHPIYLPTYIPTYLLTYLVYSIRRSLMDGQRWIASMPNPWSQKRGLCILLVSVRGNDDNDDHNDDDDDAMMTYNQRHVIG